MLLADGMGRAVPFQGLPDHLQLEWLRAEVPAYGNGTAAKSPAT